MSGQDFAKLFVIEGVGQVLATIAYSDDGEVPQLRLRIPDSGDCELSMRIGMPAGSDPEKAERLARTLFDELTEAGVANAIKPLTDARDRILGVTA